MMPCSSRAQPIRSLGSRNEQPSARLAPHYRLVNLIILNIDWRGRQEISVVDARAREERMQQI